ncbi:hypothetical protein BT96DRAFT_992213 [Gymnopus androsaceus JB14]|uniref:Uncharacterized protein n=1 Tax=Gymnopus androsaceus JB14 TaxID=1447944 RepID=A0A6A4HT41_9AGAR|nr:hypothetical protein BT96DRAFT_992213 [Gymnopus androsaceus JB14]
MDGTPLGPMVAIPHNETVDASQLHREELNRNSTLNKISTQTAAAIASYPHQPGPKPNYQPSRGTKLFTRADENDAGVASSCANASAAARFVSAALTDISNSSPVGDRSHSSDSSNTHASVGVSNGSSISGASVDAPSASTEPRLNARSSASVSNASSDSRASGDASNASSEPRFSEGPPNAPVCEHASNNTRLADVPSNASSDSRASEVGSDVHSSGDAPDSSSRPNGAASSSADGSAAVIGAVSSTNAGSNASGASADVGSSSGGALDGDTAGDCPAGPPKKKKRSEMGVEERRLMRQAAQERSEKLTADIDTLLDEQEELFAKYAELNNVSVDRVKKLAHQLPSMKPQKKASDYNVLVYFKGKELNAALGKGSKIPLKDLHAKVKQDDDLQDIFHDPEAMKALRQKYDDEKAEEKVAAIRVSKRAQAKSVAEKVNVFQQECNFLYESSDANSFGMVVRGSFESTVVSAFYGRGPADAFFRQYFRMGVQDVLNLYESYVVALEKVGTRKLYQSEMATEIVRMITQGLRKEITGVANLSMSYVSFARNIVVPYKVNITDQEAIRHLEWGGAHWYRMTAAEAKSYETNADKNGELEPKQRKKRSDAGTKRGRDDDGGSDESDSDVPVRPTKGSKRKRATVVDDEDDSDGEDGAQPVKKKSKAGAGGKSGEAEVVGGAGKLRQAVRSRRGGAGGSKKSVTQKGKKPAGGGKKSKRFVVSDSEDVGSPDNEEDDEDDAEFSD